MFWVLGLLQQRKAAGHGESQHRLGRMV